MTLDPSVAAVRLAVRRRLPEDSAAPVVVACSGGADSLALLAAAVFEGRKRGHHVVGATVDHGLQEGSGAHASQVCAQMAALGADETVAVRVQVEPRGRGVEGAAREARYAVLAEVAQRCGDTTVVLLGHTRDDQAETVLLGLARGSGARSLQGMRRGFDCFVRPLLDLTRQQTEAACRAQDIEAWADPHNADPRFTRARVRHTVLPVLEAELGPGIAATLARTADQLRADNEVLDALAGSLLAETAGPDGVRAAAVAAAPEAVRSRALRVAAVAAGGIDAELTHAHVVALGDLVRGPEGPVRHKLVRLPGHLTAYREGDLLRFRRTPVSG